MVRKLNKKSAEKAPIDDSSDEPKVQEKKIKITKKPRKKRRNRNGRVAEREIKKYQMGVEPLIPKAPFKRLIREILDDLGYDDFRVSKQAKATIQDVAEAYIVEAFKSTGIIMRSRNRTQLMPDDYLNTMLLKYNYIKTVDPVQDAAGN